VLGERRHSITVQQHWKGLGTYGTVGLEFVLSIVLGLLAGQWLDKKFGTAPWLMMIGLGYGIAAGARALYRALKRANREAEELDRAEDEARKRHDEQQ
jgi:ATP synthase protein I